MNENEYDDRRKECHAFVAVFLGLLQEKNIPAPLGIEILGNCLANIAVNIKIPKELYMQIHEQIWQCGEDLQAKKDQDQQ